MKEDDVMSNKGKISFDSLDENADYFNKPDNNAKLVDTDSLLEDRADEVDDLIESTSSASSISNLVSQNAEDFDKTDESREQLLDEIEQELGRKVNKPKPKKMMKRKDIIKQQIEDRKIVSDRDRELNNILNSTDSIEERERHFMEEEIDREEMTKDREILLSKRDKELNEIMKSIEDPNYIPKDVNKMQLEEQQKRKRPPMPPKRKPSTNRTMVSRKDYSNFFTPKYIVGGVLLIIVITVFTTILVMKTLATDVGSTISRTDKLIVRNPINNYTLQVGDVLTRVSVPSSVDSTQYDYFIKVRLTIKNKKRSKAALMSTNVFTVKSYNGEKLGDCYTASELINYNISDAIPSTILAKGTASGYLYCKTDITYLPLLEVTAAKELDQSAAIRGEIVATASSTYNINLNQ